MTSIVEGRIKDFLSRKSATLLQVDQDVRPLNVEELTAVCKIVQENHPRLAELSLQYCYIGDDGLRMLCDALRRNTNIVTLDLYCNGLSDAGLQHMHAILADSCTGLKNILLGANGFPEDLRIGVGALVACPAALEGKWLSYEGLWGFMKAASEREIIVTCERFEPRDEDKETLGELATK